MATKRPGVMGHPTTEPPTMTATEPDDTTEERSTEQAPAYGSPRLTVTQNPFSIHLREENAVPRAEVDVEVWGGGRHGERRIYLHAAGELPDGGEFGSGVAMNYLQAKRLRDLLDDALAQLERDG